MVGDHAAASQAATEMTRTVEAPFDFRTGGRLLGDCVRLAESDEHLSEAKRTELAGEYADRAVEMLRMVNKRGGAIDAHSLEADRGFDPLRSNEDYKKLLRELGKSGD